MNLAEITLTELADAVSDSQQQLPCPTQQLPPQVTIEQVVQAVLEDPSVDDCVVLVRETATSGCELVAYVVSSGGLSPRLQSNWQAVLPPDWMPRAYVPVSTVPLTNTGQVDIEALASLEVIDSDLVQQWEERVRSQPFVEQVAVVVEEYAESVSPLHLSDVLPNWLGETNALTKPVATPLRPDAVPQLGATLAISHGEELLEKPGTPTTLQSALQRTALKAIDKGIVYLQSDDSEIFQSYAALLKDAQRILAGLRKLGLKARDKVIFQFDLNQDFIPAFWGCMLGGFVPVPMSIADTYDNNHGTVTKLYNVWQMLDQPIVLTSNRLAPAVRSLSNLHIEFQVETIDHLRLCAEDITCHNAQPDDLALLLLTSGSTGMPKAVMLSHRNILSKLASTAQKNSISSQDISLNWLPLDHTSGMMAHLREVYLGCQQIQAPTRIVVQNPLKWLDWIDCYRATVTVAPNFAYGLINEYATEIQRRQWDLSSMRLIVNGGEAIVAKTARKFLKLLSNHGLPPTAMYPTWGMTETCAGIVVSNRFSLESTTDEDLFVEVGSPIPGASVRIVDTHNFVVESGKVGRLQVKGCSVTSGYDQNPKLNQEVFSDDGWFDTGDLGFLHSGRLTITGREKDAIIINGINYHSHEIEAVVEEIEGVDVSYTAAIAVRTSNSDSDRLAVFFSSPVCDDNRLIELLKEIRKQIVTKVGVNPAYLIPVERQAIPKTSIGKLQRSQLCRRFEAGEFDTILKRLDVLSSNANTLPDWFYRKIWRRKEAVLTTQPTTGQSLVFLDRLGLGARLCEELGKLNLPCVGVEAGSDFAKLSDNRYRIDPNNPDHYQQLLESVLENEIPIARVLHLWTYDEYAGEISSLEALEQSLVGVYSLLFAIQALARCQSSQQSVKLYVIATHTQPTDPNSEIACEKAPVLGLLKTIPQEMPTLDCRHVDLTLNKPEVNAAHILQEIRTHPGDREVAYRNGQRLVARLEKVDLRHEQKQEIPFKAGGMYLLSGGLGGIGVEVAQYLLKHYQARLLLVGRTELPPRSTWETYLEQEDAVSQRIKAYLSLEQLGGEIIYEAVDICDEIQLQLLVDRTKSRWQCDLDGVIHLAGIVQEHLLVEETRDSMARMLRPKVLGTWVLHQLLKDKPNSVFISSSSANSFFGGTGVGALAAANSFLDYFSHYQRYQSSLQSYCFAWSMWDEVGISRGYQTKVLSRIRGYYPITAKQGLQSLLVGLHHDLAQLLVGLDGTKPPIRRECLTDSYRMQKLSAYFTAADAEVSVAKLHSLEVRDRFGTLSLIDFRQLQQMPLTDTGEIDYKQLVTGLGTTADSVAPRTEVEQQLISIWQQVLDVPLVGIHDNFFELGGTSILAVRLFSKIEQTLGKKLPLAILLQSGTVAALAQTISQTELVGHTGPTDLARDKSKIWSSLVAIQPKGDKPPLFILHPLGGGVLCYRDLALHLGADQPVYGLQPLGLDGQQPPLTRLSDMASHYIKEMQTLQPSGPYFLAGWSFGGFVAFEMALQLHSLGEKVGSLVMIDTVRPGSYQRSPFALRVFLHLKNMFQQGPAYLRQKIASWSEHGKYHLQQRYQRYFNAAQYVSEVSQHLDEQHDEHFFKVMGANVQALDEYIFQVYPGQMTLLRTEDKYRDEAIGGQYDPQFGWGDIIVGELDIDYIPGSHLSVMEEPHIRVLAEKLKVCLEKAYATNLTREENF